MTAAPIRRVREATGPGREPRVGDRVFWSGDAVHPRRDGTVTAVYPDPEHAARRLLIDVEWDAPGAGDREPWTGTSRGLPATRLDRPGWGWADAERGGGGSVRERRS